MRRFPIRYALAAAAALVVNIGAAAAQVAPVSYWIPGGPFGFGGGAAQSWQPLSWGNVPAFTTEPDENGERAGFVARNYSAEVSAFAGWRGGLGSTGGLGGAGAFGNFAALALEGSQVGYNFKGVGGVPMTLFGGVDQLKYQPDVFTSLTSPGSSSSTAATAVHAGVEFRPTSNLSLSFSGSYVQPSGAVDSDIRSNLLPGESPMLSGGRR